MIIGRLAIGYFGKIRQSRVAARRLFAAPTPRRFADHRDFATVRHHNCSRLIAGGGER
jgi:hypothetical protein